MASGVSGHAGEPNRCARSLAALAEAIKKFVNMSQASKNNYRDKSWHISMHLRAGGGRRAAQRPTSQCICGRAAGGKAIHISMHLRAGGGRASWVRLGSNPPKTFPKTSENPPKHLPKSDQNPIQKGLQHGAQKIFVFFLLLLRLLGASWAVWAASWGLRRPKLEAKTEQKSIKNRSQNSCKFKGHLNLDFRRILVDFGSQNGAKLGSKSDQKRSLC